MRIALDYDNTFTADPYFWYLFIDMVRKHGHDVTIVTMRSEEHDTIDDHLIPNAYLDIVYCDGLPKRQFCRDNHNREFDIWIDDHPEGIHLGSAYTPEQLAEWRANGRK